VTLLSLAVVIIALLAFFWLFGLLEQFFLPVSALIIVGLLLIDLAHGAPLTRAWLDNLASLIANLINTYFGGLLR
jgi:hypothetical protein